MEAEKEKAGASKMQAAVAADGEHPLAKDAVIQVFTGENSLVAYLIIEPPVNGGAPPTMNGVKAALLAGKITHQVDFELMKNLSVNPIYLQRLVIARGVAPVDGTDGTVTFHIKTEKSELKPKVDDKGIVDYRDLDIVENVKEGQILCTITPPTEGTPGITVHGKEIPQRRGKPVPSYLGKNTKLVEDGTAIISLIDGHVEFNGAKINVEHTLRIKENVDHSTGNLHVAGNLVIGGMVLPGFAVEATGDIEIRGTVEGATVKAGGNLTVHSGVFHSELSGGQDFKCRFIENSVVFAKGDLQTESIVHSIVKCGKSIKLQGSVAKIIGGSCMAGQNIEAGSIGATSNIKTTIQLGTDPTVILRQQELVEEIAGLEMKLEKLKPLLGILQQLEAANRLTEDKKAALADVKLTNETAIKKLAEDKQELELITQAMSDKGFGRVICKHEIYPGTTVIIGRAVFNVANILTNATLYYEGGQISVGIAP